MGHKKPLVVGVGGLLEKDEKGRITDILRVLRERGCQTYEVKFSKICRNGDTVICPVSFSWAADITATITTALQDPDVDPEKIGLVGSSFGATMIDQYLASQTHLAERVHYVGIAPFSKINPLLRPRLEQARRYKQDLPISSDTDEQRGIKRVIPHSDITTILEINTPAALNNRQKNYAIIPFTIYGRNDERVEVPSIEERHRILEGLEKDLVGFDCGHNTPYEESVGLASEFLARALELSSKPSHQPYT